MPSPAEHAIETFDELSAEEQKKVAARNRHSGTGRPYDQDHRPSLANRRGNVLAARAGRTSGTSPLGLEGQADGRNRPLVTLGAGVLGGLLAPNPRTPGV